MANPFRDQIERRFEAWGRIVSARPIPVALISLLFVAICASGLSRVTIDVTFEAFLKADDPVRVAYEAFREQFGRDERIIVSAEPGSANESGVFDLAFLEKLRTFHEAIEERVPHLVEVTSLVNARNTRGEEDALLVDDFLDPWPEDAETLAELRTRALSNPLFRNNVISEDGSMTTVVLELQLYSTAAGEGDDLGGFDDPGLEGLGEDVGEDSGERMGAEWGADSDESPPLLSGNETAELVRALHRVIADFEGPDFVLHVAGSPVMLQDISGSMARDMPRFVGLAIASIALLLFVLFRRVVAVVAPLIVVILALASTIGLMGWAAIPLHVPTQILPSFLLAVGVGDGVHLLSIFFDRIRLGEDRAEALSYALGHSGLAITLTSLTTAGGLLSFATSGLAPVAVLGIFAPIGVMLALILSLTLLPALLSIAPIRELRAGATPREDNALDRLLRECGRFSTRHARVVLSATALLALAAAGFATRLELSHDPLGWLSDDTKIVGGTRYIDRALGGSVSYEVLVEADRAGGVREPEVLSRMSELGTSFEERPRDGIVAAQTVSLADVVKEINRALNADDEAAYTIPSDGPLITQELLLFENTGTDDLEEMVDSEYRMARIAVRVPWGDAVGYRVYIDLVEAEVVGAFGDLARTSITGVLAMLVKSISAVVRSMAESYVLAFAIITPLMILLLGSLRTGLLAMIPNALPILLTLGLMGAFGFPLDAFSLMVGGIALGLAVDDTIHFMHNYRRYRDHGADLGAAVDSTLQSTGRAMLITTIVLSVGFLGFVLSSMHNLTNLGILVSFAISTAFLADVLVAPALLAVFDESSEIDPPN